jgi:hypothetical protein
VKLGEKFGKLMVDLGITFFDEDGDVKSFLGRERGEVAFHGLLLGAHVVPQHTCSASVFVCTERDLRSLFPKMTMAEDRPPGRELREVGDNVIG